MFHVPAHKNAAHPAAQVVCTRLDEIEERAERRAAERARQERLAKARIAAYYAELDSVNPRLTAAPTVQPAQVALAEEFDDIPF